MLFHVCRDGFLKVNISNCIQVKIIKKIYLESSHWDEYNKTSLAYVFSYKTMWNSLTKLVNENCQKANGALRKTEDVYKPPITMPHKFDEPIPL